MAGAGTVGAWWGTHGWRDGGSGQETDGAGAHAPGDSPLSRQCCTDRRAGGQKQMAGFKSLEKKQPQIT